MDVWTTATVTDEADSEVTSMSGPRLLSIQISAHWLEDSVTVLLKNTTTTNNNHHALATA